MPSGSGSIVVGGRWRHRRPRCRHLGPLSHRCQRSQLALQRLLLRGCLPFTINLIVPVCRLLPSSKEPASRQRAKPTRFDASFLGRAHSAARGLGERGNRPERERGTTVFSQHGPIAASRTERGGRPRTPNRLPLLIHPTANREATHTKRALTGSSRVDDSRAAERAART